MTDQPTYPRLSMDMQEKVHTMASHLEIHAPFHMALDTEQRRRAITLPHAEVGNRVDAALDTPGEGER